MGVKIFAAIDVGSYMLHMKIYEFLPSNIMKEVDSIRYGIDLGTETFSTGKLSSSKVSELCKVLCDFSDIMKSYGVTQYVAYGTSAIRETQNTQILLDLIEQRTGIRIEVLSNSRQRFLTYKSVASTGEDFNTIIEKGTAILDIGGGSIQFSLFEHDTLVATQNMKLGVLRLQERLHVLASGYSKYETLLDEMINSQFEVFKKLYLKDRQIENVIVVDDYVSVLLQNKMLGSKVAGYIDQKTFLSFYDSLKNETLSDKKKNYDLDEAGLNKMYISAALISKAVGLTDAKLIWAPGICLCDGMAYEYGENKRLLKRTHDFEEDIIACAKNISKRYMGSVKRAETLESITLTIFDALKKRSGLSGRDRLLLRIAAILHDCGKYVSLYNLGDCSYNIIMSTEIIGLSHEEREIVANVVKFNHMEFESYEAIASSHLISSQQYLRITKLAAILRVANGLDRSHKQKFKDIKVNIKDREFIITVNTDKDITLEIGLLRERARFFEDVFYLKPVIKKQKEK